MKVNRMLVLLVVFLLAFSIAVLADPNGASVTEGASTTKNATVAGSANAFGGNLTELSITADSQSLNWQGFYGDVTGEITLENVAGKQMFNWTMAAVGGEIYALNGSTAPTWSNAVAETDCTVYEDVTGTGNDKVSNTFSTGTNHVAFDVGSTTISANSACAVQTYDDTTVKTAGAWEEVILDFSGPKAFVGLLEDQRAGFDGSNHDFQVLIPEDNDGTSTTWYFYVELS